MLLRLDQCDQHLSQARQQGLSSIYVLMGEEILLIQETADALRTLGRQQGIVEREIYTAERFFNWDLLLEAAQSMSLFGDRKLLELYVPSGKPGKEGAAALKAYVERQKNQTELITFIFLPRLDATTQKTEWFQTLEKNSIVFRIDTIDRATLPRWLEHRLQCQQQTLPAGEAGRRVLNFIADKVEGNLLAAHQEVSKLALLYPEGQLSEQQVYEAVLNVARYDVFKLSEAILAGDVPRTVRMLSGLEGEGEAPVLVLWALTEEIRLIQRVLLRVSEGQPLSAVMKELRIWGQRERLLPKALARLNQERLDIMLSMAADIDALSKGLKPTNLPSNIWTALQQLALNLVT